jgi:hypothetical protein
MKEGQVSQYFIGTFQEKCQFCLDVLKTHARNLHKPIKLVILNCNANYFPTVAK